VKLYKDFKADSSVTWDLNPAVRNPSKACIEESNCNWELATVCAFNQTDAGGQVNFLECMDKSEASQALSAAKKCASSGSIDDKALQTCYHGDAGKSLLAAASKAWNKQFPQRATVPHTFINGKNVEANFSALKRALCAAGSKASVCSGQVATLNDECWA